MNRAAEVIRRCRMLAACTEEPGRITRTFLSPSMRRVHEWIAEWMREAELRVSLDAAGNIRGRRGSGHSRMLIGSHLDTVPDAGAFDGILGVVMGIELARSDYNVEVVGFSEEEGVRFGVPFIGSRALVGQAQPLLDADPRIGESIRAYGLDPADLPQAALDPSTAAYFEIHIEQGPVLESLDRSIGVVETIAGQSRWTATFTGTANHAGTTPMNLRRDALAAAAEFVLAVEWEAHAVTGLVATVGRCEVTPGAGNVVPGLAELSLDVRHSDDGLRTAAVSRLITEAHEIARRRGVEIATRQTLNQPAVPMSPELVDMLAVYGEVRMPSGAGHDAMILAPVVPSVMLFVRSPGGISHHPSESVRVEDVEAALECSRKFIRDWSAHA
jgi:allantoate deiminase